LALDFGLRKLGLNHSFSIVAIKQFTVLQSFRRVGKNEFVSAWRMLLDRASRRRRWNSGNSVVYGVPLRPHVRRQRIALLALQDEQRTEMIQKSVSWPRQKRSQRRFCFQFAWCILTLFVYQSLSEA